MRNHLSTAAMVIGGLVGVSAIAWYLALGDVGTTYLALAGGLVLVTAGVFLRLSWRRLLIALVFVLLMGWPIVFGDFLWGRQ